MPARRAADLTEVRDFVAKAAGDRTPQLAARLRERFKISRPTAHNYLRALVDEGLIVRVSPGRYDLGAVRKEIFHAVEGLEEDQVWQKELQPLLVNLPPNVTDIWHYGFTEMLNNVIDHSESKEVVITVTRSAQAVDIAIHDTGVGIFRKIAKALGLEDDRHSVLELSKGKVTTDPLNHTGEGIFFSSRAFLPHTFGRCFLPAPTDH